MSPRRFRGHWGTDANSEIQRLVIGRALRAAASTDPLD
jgi:hypothetical protein